MNLQTHAGKMTRVVVWLSGLVVVPLVALVVYHLSTSSPESPLGGGAVASKEKARSELPSVPSDAADTSDQLSKTNSSSDFPRSVGSGTGSAIVHQPVFSSGVQFTPEFCDASGLSDFERAEAQKSLDEALDRLHQLQQEHLVATDETGTRFKLQSLGPSGEEIEDWLKAELVSILGDEKCEEFYQLAAFELQTKLNYFGKHEQWISFGRDGESVVMTITPVDSWGPGGAMPRKLFDSEGIPEEFRHLFELHEESN